MYGPSRMSYKKDSNVDYFCGICQTFRQKGPKDEFIWILYSCQDSNWVLRALKAIRHSDLVKFANVETVFIIIYTFYADKLDFKA